MPRRTTGLGECCGRSHRCVLSQQPTDNHRSPVNRTNQALQKGPLPSRSSQNVGERRRKELEPPAPHHGRLPSDAEVMTHPLRNPQSNGGAAVRGELNGASPIPPPPLPGIVYKGQNRTTPISEVSPKSIRNALRPPSTVRNDSPNVASCG